MSFKRISELLKGDILVRSAELHYSRIGSDDGVRPPSGKRKLLFLLSMRWR